MQINHFKGHFDYTLRLQANTLTILVFTLMVRVNTLIIPVNTLMVLVHTLFVLVNTLMVQVFTLTVLVFAGNDDFKEKWTVLMIKQNPTKEISHSKP